MAQSRDRAAHTEYPANKGHKRCGQKRSARCKNQSKVVSLCPACSQCPTVDVFGDHVRIGEGQNTVTLGKEEWNQLVDAIQAGKLGAIR